MPSGRRRSNLVRRASLIRALYIDGHTFKVSNHAGRSHNLALTSDGQVFSWGHGTYGKLGLGDESGRNRPTLVPALSNIFAVAAGDHHSLALHEDGRVFAFGLNSAGQLGLGATPSYTSQPTEIQGLADVVAIAAGSDYSFAVTAGGQLYAWGSNANTRLGASTLPNPSRTPALVNLPNVVAVAAGSGHGMALTTDGAVYSWGLGSNGQLGHGNTTSKTTPTVIAGLRASAISAGATHSAAVRFDGVLVAWGSNASGRLGDTTNTQRTSPVVVSGPSSVSTLSLGSAHSLVATPDGAIWSWGAGGSGRLGDNSTADRWTPQAVVTGLSHWQPAAPTLSSASDALLEPLTVTVSSTTTGAEMHYTLTGAEPTETDTQVPANGEIPISSAAQLRVKAFAGGRVPSVSARADFTAAFTAPTISPLTGLYTSAQQISITAAGGPPSTIRYTLVARRQPQRQVPTHHRSPFLPVRHSKPAHSRTMDRRQARLHLPR